MFMNTIAVGPFEDVASWVTGGTTVAIVRAWRCACHVCTRYDGWLSAEAYGVKGDGGTCLANWLIGIRRAIFQSGRFICCGCSSGAVAGGEDGASPKQEISE